MSDDFDWTNENKDIVVRRQDAIAVYSNPDDDTFIVIPRSGARRFIEAIERLLLPEATKDG